jgi:hypothetical protein
MSKKTYVLAIVTFLLIPAVAVVGAFVINAINPEVAAGHPDYVRNFRLLDLAKKLSMWAALLVIAGLWFLTCFFLIKSKIRSYWWLPLAVFGPLGLIVLTMLSDKRPVLGDLYQRFVGRLRIYQRVVLELCIFVAVWDVAYEAVAWKRELMIMHEAATTGVSKEQIIALQDASGGMWAFSEGLQVTYLVVLIYLLWPICFNAVSRLSKLRTTSKGAS